jgi:hypothetical protein
MPAWQGRYTALTWRKSRRSGDGPNCVEIACDESSVLVRDSHNPSGTVIAFPPDRWTAFLRRVRRS